MEEYTEEYPWVTFRLMQRDFCISSNSVTSIKIPKEIYPLPDTPAITLGIVSLDNETIEIIDLRVLFHMPTLDKEIDAFNVMKTKHLDWVDELIATVHDDRDFTMAADPHKCQFGIWYDNFATDNHSLNYILKRIEEPHRLLHHCAVDIQEYRESKNDKMIREELEKASDLCNNQIIPLLDKLIRLYSDINRGIIIILEVEGQKIGIFVDEVTGLKSFTSSEMKISKISDLKFNNYIKNIISPNDSQIYLEIDPNRIINLKHSDSLPI